MVMNVSVGAFEEIFNTYDHTIGNARLMIQYGFFLEANSHDTIEWSLAEIGAFTQGRIAGEGPPYGMDDDEFWEEMDTRYQTWRNIANMDFDHVEDELVEFIYDPNSRHYQKRNRPLRDDDDSDDDMEEWLDPSAMPKKDPSSLIQINADAWMSQQLFFYLIIHRLPASLLPPVRGSRSDTSSDESSASASASPQNQTPATHNKASPNRFSTLSTLAEATFHALMISQGIGLEVDAPLYDRHGVAIEVELSIVFEAIHLVIGDIVALCQERILLMRDGENSVEEVATRIVRPNTSNIFQKVRADRQVFADH